MGPALASGVQSSSTQLFSISCYLFFSKWDIINLASFPRQIASDFLISFNVICEEMTVKIVFGFQS